MVTGFALLDNLKGKKIRAYEILKKFSELAEEYAANLYARKVLILSWVI